MMSFKIVGVIVLSLIAALLYRLGGSAKMGHWFDIFLNTKTRDLGVPICSTLALILMCHDTPAVVERPFKFALALFFSFGLLFGSLTTYWTEDGHDVKWYNWLITGVGYGLSFLPIALFFSNWLWFGYQLIILATTITLWSTVIGKAWLEESGRGLLIILTLPLILIGLKKKEKKI